MYWFIFINYVNEYRISLVDSKKIHTLCQYYAVFILSSIYTYWNITSGSILHRKCQILHVISKHNFIFVVTFYYCINQMFVWHNRYKWVPDALGQKRLPGHTRDTYQVNYIWAIILFSFFYILPCYHEFISVQSVWGSIISCLIQYIANFLQDFSL